MAGTYFRFGAFDVDVESGQVRKHRHRVALDHKAFELLLALLERPGEVVSREELKRRLWRDDVFVEFDKNLNNAVGRLRVILGDSAASPRFIETLPRRGYRFIATVERLAPTIPAAGSAMTDLAAAPLAESTAGPGPQPAAPPPSPPDRRSLRVGLLAAAVLTTVVLGLIAWSRVPHADHTQAIEAVAVLPFLELSDGPPQPHVTEGITESLILELSRIEGLRVTSRASSSHYGRAGAPVARIAHELGVDAIIDGTVQREGDRLRVTVQLIHASADAVTWSQTYDRQVNSVLDLQREVADAIAGEVRGNLQPNMMASLTKSRRFKPEAVDLYLRGRQRLSRRTPADLARAREYFEQAIGLEPAYAQAHAGIALAWEAEASRTSSPASREAWSKAREAATRAIGIDGSLVEARIVLAIVADRFDLDPVAAEQGYERALKMSPSHPLALTRYAMYLRHRGRSGAALVIARRAQALDPLSLETNVELGLQLHAAGDLDGAIRQLERTIGLDSRYFDAYVQLVPMYLARQQPAQAIAAASRAVEFGGGSAPAIGALARAHAGSGNLAEARRLLASLEQRATDRDAWQMALLSLELGDRNAAHTWLERACEERTVEMALRDNWTSDPIFDPLRDSPRFESLADCPRR